MSRKFDGTSLTYLGGSTGTILDFTKSMTVSAWIFPTTFGAAAGNGPGYAFGFSARGGLYISSGGVLTGFHQVKTTNSQAVSVASTVVLNTWQYVTYVFNHATLVSQLFVNGTEVSYASQTTGSGGDFTAQSMVVGHLNAGSGDTGFTGSIDSLAYWNVILTPTQMQTASAYQGTPNVPTGLVAYWTLNPGTDNPEKSTPVVANNNLSVHGATQGSPSPGQQLSAPFAWIGQQEIENSFKRKH